MMDIERPIYLQKLKDRMHDGMIKIITGLEPVLILIILRN